ncbi:DMT family transporter [Paraburkholderia sp.]|uniref:DMT family transporter n=1 Tax=Paraburkholderia sp. TaxID=1926495 RepID=UPI003D6E70A5
MQKRNGTSSGDATFVVALTASTFLMGSSFVVGKVLLHAGFTPFILVGWRFLVAALATLPLAFLDGGARALVPRSSGLRVACLTVLIGLLQTTGVMGLTFLAMSSIPASTAAILLFTNPIWVAMLGKIFLGEALSASRAAGLLLGLIGVCFAIGVGPELLSGGNVMIGELLGLASSLCWAIATIINKRARLPLKPWTMNFWQMLVGSMALLALAYAHGEHWPDHATPSQWGWFFWLAIPASTGSFGLWFIALHRGGATRASSFLFLTPLFTVILSFLVLDSSLSLQQAVGGGLIGLSLWLVNRTVRHKASARNSVTVVPTIPTNIGETNQ